MGLSDYIPTGRTSLVNKDGIALQVQTEYAYRPYPRLTTTILDNGRLLHKVEKKLDKAIESFEEQAMMEERMKRQHSEIVSIIKSRKSNIQTPEKIENPITSVSALESSLVEPDPSSYTVKTMADKIKEVEGVKYLYQLDHNGNFVNKICSEQFKKSFKSVFKSIHELVEIFDVVPGLTPSRKRGVYEIEPDILYLLSTGEYLYIILISDPVKSINYSEIFSLIVSKD